MPNWPFEYDTGALTGTTTNAYAAALTWPVAHMKNKTITLKNTHASNSLLYKLEAYAAEGGMAYTLIAETTLVAGIVDLLQYEKAWYKFVLSVKAASSGNQATYALDYIGQT